MKIDTVIAQQAVKKSFKLISFINLGPSFRSFRKCTLIGPHALHVMYYMAANRIIIGEKT